MSYMAFKLYEKDPWVRALKLERQNVENFLYLGSILISTLWWKLIQKLIRQAKFYYDLCNGKVGAGPKCAKFCSQFCLDKVQISIWFDLSVSQTIHWFQYLVPSCGIIRFMLPQSYYDLNVQGSEMNGLNA